MEICRDDLADNKQTVLKKSNCPTAGRKMLNDSNRVIPESIQMYVKLFFISYGVGPVLMLFGLAPKEFYVQSIGRILFVQIATFLVLAFVVNMIVEGKNWARLFMLVSLVIGVPIIFITTPMYFNTSIVGGVLFLVANLVQAYCVYLLFCQASSSWFKKTGVDPNLRLTQDKDSI